MSNQTMQLSHDLAPFLSTLATAAKEAIMPHFRSSHDVENKAAIGFDPVTIADKAGETAIRKIINATYPEHGILGEEHGPENLSADNVWVLDPIDGTRAFITGLPTWGTLIGLKTDGKPSLGMMCQPYIDEYYSGDGLSALYKGPIGTRILKTRSCTSLAEAILCTTAPDIFPPEEQKAYDAISQQVRLARYGTDCYGYCMLAAGFADIVIESGLQPYDIVALIPIIEGAGGIVTNWAGGSAADGGQIIACATPRLHEAALRQLAAVAA